MRKESAPMMLSPKMKRKIIGKTNTTLKFFFLAIVLFLLYFPILAHRHSVIPCQRTGHGISAGSRSVGSRELFKDEALVQAITIRSRFVVLAWPWSSTVLGPLAAIGINSLYTRKKDGECSWLTMSPFLNAEVVTGVSLFFIFKFVGILIGKWIHFLLGYWTMPRAHIFFCIPYVVLSVSRSWTRWTESLRCGFGSRLHTENRSPKVLIPSHWLACSRECTSVFTMSLTISSSAIWLRAEVENFSMWFYANHKRSGRTRAWAEGLIAYNTYCFRAGDFDSCGS